MKKLFIASALLASSSSALAGGFFGGSVGYSQTKINTSIDNKDPINIHILSDSPSTKSGAIIAIEGGNEIEINKDFSITAEGFLDVNLYNFEEETNSIFIGAKTRAIQKLSNDLSVYGGVGLGIISWKLENINMKITPAIKLALGGEIVISKNVKTFAEVVYDTTIKDFTFTEEMGLLTSKNKHTKMGARIGARFFF